MEKLKDAQLHELKLMAAMASIMKVAELIDATDDIETMNPLPRAMVHLVGLATVICEVPEEHRDMVLQGSIDGLPLMVEALERKLGRGTVQ